MLLAIEAASCRRHGSSLVSTRASSIPIVLAPAEIAVCAMSMPWRNIRSCAFSAASAASCSLGDSESASNLRTFSTRAGSGLTAVTGSPPAAQRNGLLHEPRQPPSSVRAIHAAALLPIWSTPLLARPLAGVDARDEPRGLTSAITRTGRPRRTWLGAVRIAQPAVDGLERDPHRRGDLAQQQPLLAQRARPLHPARQPRSHLAS